MDLVGMLAFIAYQLINVFIFIVIIGVVMSWLIAFNIINIRNQFVNMIWRTANSLTEPVLRPVRQMLPNMGGIDISPLIVIIVLWAVQGYILRPLL